MSGACALFLFFFFFYGSPIKSTRTGKQNNKAGKSARCRPRPLRLGRAGYQLAHRDARDARTKLRSPLPASHISADSSSARAASDYTSASPSLERQAEFSSRYREFLAWEWDPFMLNLSSPPALWGKFD